MPTRTDLLANTGVEIPMVSKTAIVVSVIATVICFSLTIGGWALGSDGPSHEARSVIGPVWLQVNPTRIPRTVSALVDTTSLTLATGNGLFVSPVEDTQLTLVSYRADDPELARDGANAAAAELVDVLNERGFGVGRFAIITPAEVRPRSSAGPLAALLMGALASLCFVGCAQGARRAVRIFGRERR